MTNIPNSKRAYFALAIVSGVLAAGVISFSQSQLQAPVKYVVSAVGGGCLGVMIIAIQKSRDAA